MRTIGAALLLGVGCAHMGDAEKLTRRPFSEPQKHGVCRNFYAALKPRFFLAQNAAGLYREI